MNGKRLTNKILANLAKPRPERTEAEVFAGLSEEDKANGLTAAEFDSLAGIAPDITEDQESAAYGKARWAPEACCECHLSKSEFREGPVLRCLRCQKALCFLCTGAHLDCRNRCEEAK